MTAAPSHETLISRLRQEIETFQLPGDLSSSDLCHARKLDNWTCIYHPNTYIEICGTVSRGPRTKDELIMAGRILHVDLEDQLVLTTEGAFPLGSRQKSDRTNLRGKPGEQVTELEAVKVKLEEYRHDLWVASRYMAEITPSMWAL